MWAWTSVSIKTIRKWVSFIESWNPMDHIRKHSLVKTLTTVWRPMDSYAALIFTDASSPPQIHVSNAAWHMPYVTTALFNFSNHTVVLSVWKGLGVHPSMFECLHLHRFDVWLQDDYFNWCHHLSLSQDITIYDDVNELELIMCLERSEWRVQLKWKRPSIPFCWK